MPRVRRGKSQPRRERAFNSLQRTVSRASFDTQIVPDTVALVLTGFAPTVATPVVVTPGKLSLVLSEFAPAVATPRVVTPGKLGLTLTGFAPAVATPRVVTPGRLALTLTTFAPTASVPLSVTVSPAAATLTLTGNSPDVQGDLHTGEFGHVVSDTSRRTRFAVLAGSDEEANPVSITPPTARLTLVGLPPAISSRSAVAFTLEELAGLDLTAEELAALLAA